MSTKRNLCITKNYFLMLLLNLSVHLKMRFLQLFLSMKLLSKVLNISSNWMKMLFFHWFLKVSYLAKYLKFLEFVLYILALTWPMRRIKSCMENATILMDMVTTTKVRKNRCQVLLIFSSLYFHEQRFFRKALKTRPHWLYTPISYSDFPSIA